MPKKRIHVKSYFRNKHGRANFGGKVSSHDKQIRSEFKTLTNLVEMSQGPFVKKPKLMIKDWKYATNHVEETPSGKPVRASVIIDKKAAKDDNLRRFLELHELRENQLMQHGLNEDVAHPTAMQYAPVDKAVLNLGDPDRKAMKIYKTVPPIFTDQELNSLKNTQIFPKR